MFDEIAKRFVGVGRVSVLVKVLEEALYLAVLADPTQDPGPRRVAPMDAFSLRLASIDPRLNERQASPNQCFAVLSDPCLKIGILEPPEVRSLGLRIESTPNRAAEQFRSQQGVVAGCKPAAADRDASLVRGADDAIAEVLDCECRPRCQ